MARLMLGFVVLTAVFGCSSSVETRASQLEIQFVDSRLFDDELQSALARGYDQVTVRFAGSDVTLNRIPERIDHWLYLVSKRYDGTVDVEVDPEVAGGRGIGVGSVVSLAVGAYSSLMERIYYRPARNYNIIVYHAPGDARVTRVVFARRPAE